MSNFIRWFTFLVVVFLSACVPNRKFVYLQKNDINVKDLQKNTIVRSYDIDQYEYKIQPEDIISVRFESLTTKDYDFLNNGQANLNTNAQVTGVLLIGELVDKNGEIPFPFIGKVKVGGFTVFEIQDNLQKVVTQYLESPVVKVRLLNFRYTILGEVNKEGTIVLNNNRVNLLEAIGWSGGMTDLADKANVKLIRQVGGVTTIQYLNLLNEDFINSPFYYIHQNDVLIVPALKQRPYHKYFGQNIALIATSFTLLLLVISLRK